ncbi:MAG: mannose-6-phosphate isomerase [Halioglobus sp.]
MSRAKLLPLDNPVRDYAWGDTERLGALFGLQNPEGKPQAEIWMGAHPGAPSIARFPGGESEGESQRLDELVAAAPQQVLGEHTSERFGGQLPFLFKVLNAGQPLSIQLHPTKALAEAGFEREEAAGIPRDAAERNYVDANHKPELIYALTPFRALCGFRPLNEIVTDLARLQSTVLAEPLDSLTAGGDAEALRDFCKWLLQLSQSEVNSMLSDALDAATHIDEPAFRELLSLHEYYPSDRGVLFGILLNIVELQPGESLFMAPGHLHSYLGGVGLEIMASSDNVIRGGLTPKHVDCEELMRLATFEPLPPAELLVQPERRGAQTCYPTPVDDFALALVDVEGDGEICDIVSAEILFCVSGEVSVTSTGERVNLAAGEACLVCADAGGFTLGGSGQLARAAVAIP